MYSSSSSRFVEDMLISSLKGVAVAVAVARGHITVDGDKDCHFPARNSRNGNNGNNAGKDRGAGSETHLTVAATPAGWYQGRTPYPPGAAPGTITCGDAGMKNMLLISMPHPKGLRGTATIVISMDTPADFFVRVIDSLPSPAQPAGIPLYVSVVSTALHPTHGNNFGGRKNGGGYSAVPRLQPQQQIGNGFGGFPQHGGASVAVVMAFFTQQQTQKQIGGGGFGGLPQQVGGFSAVASV